MSHNITARVNELQNHIKSGRIIEAMREFYDDNIAMQENSADPVVGLQANIEREEEFLANVKEFISYEPLAIAVSGDVSFVESRMEFIDQQDNRVVLQQATRQRWNNNKITHETFYHG